MRRVLIANRGEIACRLLKACRELGLETVAVYATPDADAPHVRLADFARELPGTSPAETYLNAPALLARAQGCGADALHPGYGFLSEDAAFARACREAGLTFVGPPTEAIARMGDKLEARAVAEAAAVPVLPGGTLEDGDALPETYPVMIKAALGGGGMGLRRVAELKGLEAAIAEAQAQAAQAFGADRGRLYWETYAQGARHIEVQIAGDAHGRVVALGERECSVQRRYQKLIEECPAPGLDAATRAELAALAVSVAQSVGYQSVGTVEFLWTPELGPRFLEMNTRLQVEHAVTEQVWGLDLPQLQLRLAMGDSLEALLPPWGPRGHAIEARLYAEDPQTGLPAPGRIDHLSWPMDPWLRVDAGTAAGVGVPPYYDALLAKLVAWGPDRATAVRRLADALSRVEIAGTLVTNLSRLRAVLAEPAFVAGELHTHFLERELLIPELAPEAAAAAVACLPAADGSVSQAAHWAARRWR
ncbi:MAG TPA: biotin carboxylase N-terminal domain-containing protein [Oscillatoriaceae cyanobacterium]